MIRCTACKDPLPSVGVVPCAGCDGSFHFECSGLSRKTWNAKGAAKKLEWRCWYCRRASRGGATPRQVSTLADPPPLRTTRDPIAERVGGDRGASTHDAAGQQFGIDDVPLAPAATPTPFHATLSDLHRRSRIIPRIPKGARILAAEQLTAAIIAAVSNNDEASWQRLLLFSFAVLRRPQEEKRVSLTTRIKSNLAAFAEGREDYVGPHHTDCRPTRRASTTTSQRAQAKLGDGDVKGAVRLLCSEDIVAPFTPETLGQLREKHPPAKKNPHFPAPPPPSSAEAQPRQPQRTTGREVADAVKSFAAGSAGGLDGMRPQHLKDLLSPANGVAATNLSGALAELMDLMLSGRVPAEVCPYLYGANLIALKKKCGGIRPIAVGNTLRRLAAKIGCRRVQASMGETLRPHQLGFGTPGGAEAAIHATRRFVDEPGPPRVILKLDYINAFNSMFRDHMLSSIGDDSPSLYPLAWQSYRDNSILSFGDETLESAEGCQQGDPCGPLFFCLGLQPLCRELNSPLNVWYLDDGTLGGPLHTIMEDVRSAHAFSDRSGLVLNPGKCEVFFVGHSPEEEVAALAALEGLLPGIRRVQRQDLCLLGSPLTEDAIPRVLDDRLAAATRMGTRLQDCSAHNALYLLKNCLAIPKLTYIVRTCPSWLFEGNLRAIDESFRTTLQCICNTTIEGAAWRQATLPVNKGGLGIRRIEELALPAFLASSYSTGPLVAKLLSHTWIADTGVENIGCCRRVADAENAWLLESEKLTEATFALPPLDQRGVQKRWDDPLSEQRLKNLLCEARRALQAAEAQDPDPKSELRRSASSTVARLLAAATKESGLWIHALPSPSLGTLLEPDALRVAVALRLGAPICAVHSCRCGALVNQLGHHGLSCRLSAGRHPRHHALNDVVCRALGSAGVPSRLEPTGLAHDAGLRADGLTLVPWSRGKSLAWDVTCVDTFAASHLSSTSQAPGTAAEGAENLKRTKYLPLSDRYNFVPLGFETTGTFGPSCSAFIRELGSRISSTTGEIRATEFLRQRFSVEIQKGNALAIFGTFPPSKTFEEMFLLL